MRETNRRRKPTTPGEILREEFLIPLGLTQKRLADHLGCDVKVVNRIVNGRSSVTAEMALKLGAAFRTTPEFWINAHLAVVILPAEVGLDLPALAQVQLHTGLVLLAAPDALDVRPYLPYGFPYEDDPEHRRHRHGAAQARGGPPGAYNVGPRRDGAAPAVPLPEEAGGSASAPDVPEWWHAGRRRRPGRPVPGHGGTVVIVVDTNVLVYAADADSPFHASCRE